MRETQTILVFRALPLGGMLAAVPTLRALRVARPSAVVTLVGLPSARAFAERFPGYIDEFRAFPGFPGAPDRPPVERAVARFLADMRARHFDLVIQLHGSGLLTNPLCLVFGGRSLAGFHLPGELCPDPAQFLPFPAAEPEVRRGLLLLERLQIPTQSERLEFPVLPQDERVLDAAPEVRAVMASPYVCIHPGDADAARRWPPERFAAVADKLAAQGLRVVLTGAASERGATAAVRRAMHAPCLDTAPLDFGLGPLAALLAGARLLICNDNGVSQLADALRVPSVVIYLATARHQTAPLDTTLHRALYAANGLSPARVAAIARQLLTRAEALST